MATDEKRIVNQSDHVAQFVANLVTNTADWGRYAAAKLEEGDTQEAATALAHVGENLAELEKHGVLTVQVVAGLQEALITAIAQRDHLVENYQAVKATFDVQVHAALSESLEHILTCGECLDDAEIEHLANAMMEEDFQTVANRAREVLEEQIAEAQKLAQEWSGESPEPPGIASGLTFAPDPKFDPTSYVGDDDIDEDSDDEPDEDEEG